MALRFEQSFVVKAPRGRVWEYLTDPHRVVTALPGAAVTGQTDETTYSGTITVKVGPVSARYRGTARFEKLDPESGVAEVAASGQDLSGRGGADMRMSSRLVERVPGETEVSVVSEVNVTGALAQFGRGMIQDVSDQMFQRFTLAVREALEQPLPEAAPAVPAATPVPAPPIQLVSFGSQIALRALGRAARQPLFWVVIVLAALVLYFVLIR
jgi:carbon monoxide dehydrogenase subunit G